MENGVLTSPFDAMIGSLPPASVGGSGPGMVPGKERIQSMKQKLNAHTPGPWHIVAQAMDADTERHARACNPYAFRRHIATHPDLDDPECRIVADMRDGPEGDARLIAAAPEMLAALEVLESSTCGDVGDDGYEGCIRIDVRALDRARAAIAKARGEA